MCVYTQPNRFHSLFTNIHGFENSIGVVKAGGVVIVKTRWLFTLLRERADNKNFIDSIQEMRMFMIYILNNILNVMY